MCTDKQIEYVQKLAKWKSQNIDLDKVAQMTTEEVSELIEELKARKSQKEKNVTPGPSLEKKGQETSPKPASLVIADVTPQEGKPFDKVRFGLASKLAFQSSNPAWVMENPEKYGIVVLAVYKALNKAEEVVKASSPSSPPPAAPVERIKARSNERLPDGSDYADYLYEMAKDMELELQQRKVRA